MENLDVNAIGGIGFDATCSLVALDYEDKPISVSPTGILKFLFGRICLL